MAKNEGNQTSEGRATMSASAPCKASSAQEILTAAGKPNLLSGRTINLFCGGDRASTRAK
ncbi:MAG: hypothetical protein FJ272_19000 [Planctomycetes bacterium]|nr:hypothetical protein [Planctomycetota bacterium]